MFNQPMNQIMRFDNVHTIIHFVYVSSRLTDFGRHVNSNGSILFFLMNQEEIVTI
jgi:hypothetical protein